MSKYIIENCPCYDYGFCTSKTIYVAGCSQRTDCKIKQIVEMCKDKMDTEFNSGSIFAEEILNLLQIEEIE